MGCRLNKLPKHDAQRPGNIYSTLKRPQVETRTDVSYEYRFLDFTTLDNGIPNCNAVRISSLRDLPSQLQELYQQGYVLATVHPFVQPVPWKERNPLEQIFRAVLVKKTQRSEKPELPGESCSLVVECCAPADCLKDQGIQKDFVKTVEDAASRGLRFVAIVHQYNTQSSRKGSPPKAPENNHATEAATGAVSSSNNHSLRHPEVHRLPDGHQKPSQIDGSADQPGGTIEESAILGTEHAASEGRQGDAEMLPGETVKSVAAQEENKEPEETETPAFLKDQLAEAEIFAIFNKPQNHRRHEYYTVKVPIRICKNGQSANIMEANWLEHMTEHFRRGGSLVNTAFYPGMVNDPSPGYTDGVFIFENSPEGENKAIKGYDAIVVEQLTLIEGTRVHTDYVPLLNSLAEYGWQLTCVLPTPISRIDSEGNSSTKQIVFLQRPFLPHKSKKKDSKFPWRFSKEDKQGRKSKKSAKAKTNSRKQQSSERKLESNCVENERNSSVLPKSDATEDHNPELRNGEDDIMSREAADLHERTTSPGPTESQDGAQTMLCPSSPISTQVEETEGRTANEEPNSLWKEDTEGGVEEKCNREMEDERNDGTVTAPQQIETLSN